MKPVLINGELWAIKRVSPDNPFLVDRTGTMRIATTDPSTRTIYLSSGVNPPLLDRVLLHEVAHAITISHGLLPPLRHSIPEDMWIPMEEWSASFMERHAAEAVMLTSQLLGRPLCINGYCIMTKTN